MRMWMVDPTVMCREHLLGEHKELHMFIGTILAGKSLGRYITDGLLEVHSIVDRHEELVREFRRRGWKHASPIQTEFTPYVLGNIDRRQSRLDLFGRCWECRDRMSPP